MVASQLHARYSMGSAHVTNELVVLFSEYSKDRPWVLVEVGIALGLEKPIVAIMDKVSPKDLPQIITPYKAIDLNDFDQYLGQVSRRARGRQR